MRQHKSLVWAVTGLFVVVSMLLASCAPQPEAAETATEAPKVAN